MEFDWGSCWREMQRHPEWFFPYGRESRADRTGLPVGECVICQRTRDAGIDEQICTCNVVVALRGQIACLDERVRYLEHENGVDGE